MLFGVHLGDMRNVVDSYVRHLFGNTPDDGFSSFARGETLVDQFDYALCIFSRAHLSAPMWLEL
jgi:hypothetical protein